MFGRKNRGGSDSTQSRVESVPQNNDGPHDKAMIDDVESYYKDLGFSHANLGSLIIGVPQGRNLNVVLDPNGQPEFHILSNDARVVPRVYAAPKSAGQWRLWVTDLREQLEKQGAEATIEDGPWGRELVAELPGAVFRAIGVDGHRWMAEVRVMSVTTSADAAAEEGRDIMRHLIVNRGSSPMPVREHLPLTIPDDVQKALVEAQRQAAAGQAAGQTAGQQKQNPSPQVPSSHQGNPGRQNAQSPTTPPVQNSPGGGVTQPPQRETSAMDRIRRDNDTL